MAEKKPKKRINVYEMAGKAGKGVRKVGGYALAIGLTYLSVKHPDVLKRIKKS